MQKKILSSVSSQILYIFVATLVGLALVPITINMLGKLQYGVFELILSLILIDMFLEFGIGSTLVKYVPEYKHNKEKLKSFVWSYYYIKLILTFIGFFIVCFIGFNFNTIFNVANIDNLEDVKVAVYLFGLGLFISSTATTLDNYLKGYVYFGLTNIVRVFSLVLFFITIYIYYTQSVTYNIVDIAFIWFILKPLFLLILLILSLKRVDLQFILKPVKFEYNIVYRTLKYMFGMTYIVMIAQLYNRLPKIIIGIVLNPIYVAYWGIMEKIKEPLLQLNNSLIRPLIPILSDRENFNKLDKKKILLINRFQYLFISFLGIMTISHIKLFISLWLGNGYDDVINIIKIILIAFLFPNAGVFLMMYYAEGKTKINTIFVTSNTIVSLTLGTILLLVTKDINIFAWSFSIILIVMSFINIFRYTKYFKISNINFIKDSILPPFMMVIIFFIINCFISQYFSFNLFGLVSSIFISVFIYILLFFIFMKSEDKQLLLKIRKKRLD
jgi:O-antigen/teichoic acid export membrane protein